MINVSSRFGQAARFCLFGTKGLWYPAGEEREIGITELSQRVMMSKSTVYRFLQTMKSLGYVAQEGESEKYSLTLKLFELGARLQ